MAIPGTTMSKPFMLYIIGIIQFLCGLSHALYETTLLGGLALTSGSFGIMLAAMGLGGSGVLFLVAGALLLILGLIFVLFFFFRLIVGIKEIIGAINLMRGLVKGYIRAKRMARGDVWSILLLNGFAFLAGILCWILLDGHSVRSYFAAKMR